MIRTPMMVLVMMAAAVGAFALDVDKQELQSVDREIVFINYQGPYEQVSTADEIKAIGFFLASALKEDGRRADFLDKYSVIRAVDPQETGKLDSDIFVIEKGATVDHIDNVRRIVAAYLERSFQYSPQDAATLAYFATIYNAVYRGHMEYFQDKYKALVLSFLSRESAGISVRYDEWPGATRMLIPLAGEPVPGKLSSMSTSELTEKKVVEEARKSPDMGLEQRKGMVELKEREVQEKKQELAQERQQLAQEEQKLEEKQAEAAQAAPGPERQQAQAEAAQQEQKVQEQKQQVTTTEKQIAQKEQEIAQERQQIIADEQAQERKQAEKQAETGLPGTFVFSDQLYYLKTRARDASGGITSTLSILDPKGPAVSVTSPVSFIRGRAFYFFRQSVLVAAHEGGPSSAVRLMLLHPLSLEKQAQSTETLYPDSYLLIQGGAIYAVTADGRLGRFDEKLELAARSEAPVERDSAFSLFGDKIYVNGTGGQILVLDRQELTGSDVIR